MKSKNLTPIVFLLLALACSSDNSKQASSRDTLTQRQKDSIVANSRLPGAGAVKRAMTNADSTSAGVQRANALATDSSQF